MLAEVHVLCCGYNMMFIPTSYMVMVSCFDTAVPRSERRCPKKKKIMYGTVGRLLNIQCEPGRLVPCSDRLVPHYFLGPEQNMRVQVIISSVFELYC